MFLLPAFPHTYGTTCRARLSLRYRSFWSPELLLRGRSRPAPALHPRRRRKEKIVPPERRLRGDCWQPACLSRCFRCSFASAGAKCTFPRGPTQEKVNGVPFRALSPDRSSIRERRGLCLLIFVVLLLEGADCGFGRGRERTRTRVGAAASFDGVGAQLRPRAGKTSGGHCAWQLGRRDTFSSPPSALCANLGDCFPPSLFFGIACASERASPQISLPTPGGIDALLRFWRQISAHSRLVSRPYRGPPPLLPRSTSPFPLRRVVARGAFVLRRDGFLFRHRSNRRRRRRTPFHPSRSHFARVPALPCGEKFVAAFGPFSRDTWKRTKCREQSWTRCGGTIKKDEKREPFSKCAGTLEARTRGLPLSIRRYGAGDPGFSGNETTCNEIGAKVGQAVGPACVCVCLPTLHGGPP